MPLRSAPDDRSVNELAEFGVIALDKPPGPSAHQVSAWVRDMVEVEKAAHAGTLDPKVTGCLPILTGTATRAVPALQNRPKEYVAVLVLHGEPPTDLVAVAGEFEGPIYQKPPRRSAVSRRLRVREIYDLDVLERDGRNVLLRIRCESGTYVRKLCHDLGLALGTGAHMGDLRRSAVDPFDDSELVTLHDLKDALVTAAGEEEGLEEADESWLRDVIQPAERVFEGLPRVTIAESAAEQVAEGAPVYAPGVIEVDEAARAALEANSDELVVCYTPDGAAVCLGRLVGDPDADEGEAVTLERVLV